MLHQWCHRFTFYQPCYFKLPSLAVYYNNKGKKKKKGLVFSLSLSVWVCGHKNKLSSEHHQWVAYHRGRDKSHLASQATTHMVKESHCFWIKVWSVFMRGLLDLWCGLLVVDSVGSCGFVDVGVGLWVSCCNRFCGCHDGAVVAMS